ncbi:MAG TPA: hypothetical protein PKE47_06805, partial [Verrucomicrobiota bacterium]|nr:hypothetical protein [Verrucomicrobiota bacterium]
MDPFTRLPEDGTPSLRLPFVPAAAADGFGGATAVSADTPPDLKFIRNVAGAGLAGGEHMVRRHHESLWRAANDAALEQWRTAARRVDLRLALMRLVAWSARRRLRFTPRTSRTPAWTPWERSVFAAALLGLAVLLTASVTGVYTLLRSTAVFADAPAACLLTAMFVGLMPAGGKLVMEQLPSENARGWFRLGLGALTVLLFAAWAVLLARFTGGLAGEVPDVLAVADQARTADASWPLSAHLQWVQLVAELCGALTCHAYAELVYIRRGPGGRTVNPRYAMLLAQAVAQGDAIDDELRCQGRAR